MDRRKIQQQQQQGAKDENGFLGDLISVKMVIAAPGRAGPWVGGNGPNGQGTGCRTLDSRSWSVQPIEAEMDTNIRGDRSLLLLADLFSAAVATRFPRIGPLLLNIYGHIRNEMSILK